MHTNQPNRVPVSLKLTKILFLSMLSLTVSCSSIQITPPIPTPTQNPYIPATDALVTFRVTIPEPLEAGDSLYLEIVDEVTGLEINPKRFIMEAEDETHYYVIMPIVLNSMIKYRFQRQGSMDAQEHLPDGRPVRYRLYHVQGPSIVQDMIACWSYKNHEKPTGELRGNITDSITGRGLPSVMVVAGGNQVYSNADGSFTISSLSPGIHNLVALSTDGSYQSFQQGALIQANMSTHADIVLKPSDLVAVSFLIDIPEDIPPEAPIRIAGNLNQLGNSFADLSGGINSLVSQMPTLTKQQDGLYSILLHLPSGFDLRYKYTLGDGFWNAERTENGEYALRQVIIPDNDIQILDSIYSWSYGVQGKISIEAHVPIVSPNNHHVFIQLDPGIGWTEPIPMWGKPNEDESTIWSYTLNSPLDKLSALKYRFCLDGECNEAYNIDMPVSSPQEYSVAINDQPQYLTNHISAWSGQPGIPSPALIPNVTVTPRSDDFIAGIALQDHYLPSWSNKIPLAISDINNLYANWVFLQPTWSYTSFSPPFLEYSPSADPGYYDLSKWINHAHLLSLSVALIPLTNLTQQTIENQVNAYPNGSEWNLWFENYSRMLTHFAELAEDTGTEAIVIGADLVVLPLASDMVKPASIDTSAWTTLIYNLREIYNGKLIWATSYTEKIEPLPISDELIDGFYILWSPPLSTKPDATSRQMRDQALKLIDRDLHPLWQEHKKPLILAINYPSPTMSEQMNAYNAMMMAINDRDWLDGVVSMEYYPPLPLQDSSTSVHGKPASGVLWYWYPLFLGE